MPGLCMSMVKPTSPAHSGFSVAIAKGQIQPGWGSGSFPFLEGQEVRVILFNEPSIGKAKITVIAYDNVIQDSDLHDIAYKHRPR
jgi:hypothetical protein